jgi:hypothetical protein
MPGFLDVLGSLATGAGTGIETGLGIAAHQDEQRRKRTQDLMARKLQEAQLSDYQRRAQEAREDRDRAAREAEQADADAILNAQNREVLAAEYLHQNPEAATRYGTDFRQGGSARANFDQIVAEAQAWKQAEATKQFATEFPGQFTTPARPEAPRRDYQGEAVAKTAQELYEQRVDDTYTIQDARRDAQQIHGLTGTTVAGAEGEEGRLLAESGLTDQDVELMVGAIVSGTSSMEELRDTMGLDVEDPDPTRVALFNLIGRIVSERRQEVPFDIIGGSEAVQRSRGQRGGAPRVAPRRGPQIGGVALAPPGVARESTRP